jgi:hypothetical protein
VGASVTLVNPSVAVEPGAEAVVDLQLRNTGAVVDEFTFDILGDTAAWTTVDPATLSLFPGAEGTARIAFRPPRAATTPAGAIRYGLRARSREDPGGSTVEEGIVEVGAFVEPHAELVPRSSRGSRGASHELAIDNRGNARLSAEIAAADADRLLRFDVNPPGVVVEPGMAGFAKIRVKPAKRFWRGQPKSRPFQLAVTPEGRLPILLDGTMLQEAVLPPWFGRLVVALLVALLGAVLLWAFVLKPTIESTVGDAVSSPIADMRADVNDALGAAGLPTMAPDDGSSAGGGTPTVAPPTATPAPGETPPPGDPATPPPDPGTVIPGLGNPVDGQLNKENPTYVAEGTLFVTDLVFSNPSAQEGAAIVLRGVDELLRLRLENYRDYDLHFVTPIVIAKGDSLSLALDCTVAEKPCDPAVFYSGYLRP